MISSRQRFRPVALASAWPSGSAFFKTTTPMSDYGILAIASAMEASAARMEGSARTSESRGILMARAVFLVHLAGVLRGWGPKPQHTVVEEDDII